MNFKLLLCYWLLICSLIVNAQVVDVEFKIIEKGHDEPLIGATVYFEELGIGSTTNLEGIAVVKNIPIGEQHLEISFIGFETIETDLLVTEDMGLQTFELGEAVEEMEEVTVKATRSTRTIKNIPTRVEFINAEELQEKAIMNAANISLVLRESTGIQIQQNSLNSGSSSIKIQGLDGRFTQLLKDGFPLYGGFSGGLSIMQIPPLDLQQFEIIKGSNSTLYGGGAIAGLVNMVSKTPQDEPELEIMLTQTHALASTANVFFSQRKDKVGFTLYGAGNYQFPYDPDGDDFTNLPLTKTVSINPKLFIYPNKKSTLWLGVNTTYDFREGGDLTVIKEASSPAHLFFETNQSLRVNNQVVYQNSVTESFGIEVKNSVSYYDNEIASNDFNFQGKQWNSFSEANLIKESKRSEWIAGFNVYTNHFDEISSLNRDQNDIIIGGFASNTYDINKSLVLESGFRLDYAPDWGVFPLPRLSLLWKASNHFSSRIGGGLGYKIPDMFIEDATAINFMGVNAINKSSLKAERSYGGNIDFNYKNVIAEKVPFSINQLFYVTAIDNNLLLQYDEVSGLNNIVNANGFVLSNGAETNVKFTYKDFRWFINYAFIHTTLNYLEGKPVKPLTPKHNAGTVLMYENDKWRIGYETYYTGKQRLSNGTLTDDYVMMGLLIQKHFNWGSPYINFENFTDRRQARYSPETSGEHTTPTFNELYMPTDGFIFSVGIIIKPFGNEQEHH